MHASDECKLRNANLKMRMLRREAHCMLCVPPSCTLSQCSAWGGCAAHEHYRTRSPCELTLVALGPFSSGA